MIGVLMRPECDSAVNAKAPAQSKPRVQQNEKRPRIYLMDLWSFIPYYMAKLCASLQDQSVDVVLGSTRYHLDRDFFRRCAVNPDPALLGWGGHLQSPFFRRLVKSCEYLLNLLLLCVRFSIARPAIVHIQFLPFLDRGFSFETWFLRWCLGRGIRIVYTVHNLPERDARTHSKLLHQRAYSSAHALICHSEGAKNQLTKNFGLPEDRIWTIPHGPLFERRQEVTMAEARAHLGLAADEAIVLCLGVINKYKGIRFLLDSWKLLISSGARARLVIAGTGAADLLADIRQRVSILELEASVDLCLHFIPVEQLPTFHVASDILVYPYQTGTTSGALLTGMNYGKAIVATKIPFFLEHLKDGENALLVDYADTEGLSRALRKLINDREERNRLAQGIQERTSWIDIARATKACYESVLDLSREKFG
jgi:glycosyltransferase involved in cell wall biosynthesis